MVLRMMKRCLLGPRLRSMECLVWLMSATAIVFLVYSLGKLQSQYLIQSSVMVEPKDGEGRRVLSLVKVYDKAGSNSPNNNGGGGGANDDAAAAGQAAPAGYQRNRRDSRIRKLLKNNGGYVPPGDGQEGEQEGELDELDGYNYFMVSEDEARHQEEEEAERSLRHHHRHRPDPYHHHAPAPPPPPLLPHHQGSPPRQETHINKQSGWMDHPPNVEFHQEVKQAVAIRTGLTSDSAFKDQQKQQEDQAVAGDSEPHHDSSLKFLYIDEHGNKVYGAGFKKPKFEPLQINVNRGSNVAQLEQGPEVVDGHAAAAARASAELKKNSNDIIRQYVEQNIKRRTSEREAARGGGGGGGAAPPRAHHLFVTTSGRFGNHLFQYASIYGLARATNRTPFLATGTEIPATFIKSRFSIAEGDAPSYVTMVHESNSGIYSPTLYNLPPEDVVVCCYLQSWKYFNNYKTMIKHLFRFKRTIRERAHQLLEDSRRTYFRKNPDVYSPGQRLTFIGVHVRRGDYMLREHLQRGYRPAPLNYLRQAMNYFRRKYANIVFVVSSDDMSWSMQHLNDTDVTFVSSSDQGVDLAALAACNHTVMTVGTYGWWAGWLAGGEVVYYRDWILPGSEIESSYNQEDYFLPEWKGIGD